MNANKTFLVAFVSMWLLAQVGVFFALVNESVPLFWASAAAAWIGALGIAVCMILKKGQTLLWLIPVLAIWFAPTPLALMGFNVPSTISLILWITGLMMLQKLPDKTKLNEAGQGQLAVAHS